MVANSARILEKGNSINPLVMPKYLIRLCMQLDRPYVVALKSSCRTIGQQQFGTTGKIVDESLSSWVSRDQIPSALTPIVKAATSMEGVSASSTQTKKRSQPTDKTVSAAIAALEVFLPGSSTGNFSLQVQ